MRKNKKLHFLLIYPLQTAPSQRFRFEQFFPALEENGFTCSTDCFYDRKTFSILYEKGGKLGLAIRLVFCFFRRCGHMFTLGKYDCILLQRGAAPFGPPLFEWIIRFIYRKPIIYDFDDAIWLQPGNSSWLQRWIKSVSKVEKICRWAHTVVVGNQYLAEYARQNSRQVMIIPTVVDTEKQFVPRPFTSSKITIGWTGSHTTLRYLEAMEPLLQKLQDRYGFDLMVMANRSPHFQKLSYQFVPWSEETEVQELNKIDIGIMPLPDDEWTKGKCGFKAIQYMALGKPAVASAVGINKEIIDQGVNGFLPSNDKEWEDNLSYLLENPDKGREQGWAARLKIEEKFSLRKASVQWLAVLQAV